ncbi:hypothetical protein TraAM80_03376 [Trypanosoma rangeli]|uniref:Uncharacterized protein n=1 Tax=Trypanosoma rangeli TaxID=5698 RepID=A0A3R7NT57_TRYRA|nr:uncharacterized protein TraAM80_03376 [Trypanosoma rangeli]RNF07255.1 hypothetical protein TraAM80_03376 [Trypanosoma rangeli]|eukprot:RNF07255.1 hypothetical protein TraAM80_03376 [Trypanosoma rangeli]
MVTIGPTVVVPILAICALLLVLILAVLIYYWYQLRRRKGIMNYLMYPGFTRHHILELSCVPSPGVHQSPLVVQLQCLQQHPCDILLDVKFVPGPGAAVNSGIGGGADNIVRLLGTDECYGDHFMLYTEPLEFIDPGSYTVYAYAVYPSLQVVGSVHQFSFGVVSEERAAPRVELQDSQQISVNIERSGPGSPSFAPRGGHARPLPPRIIPERGEVTTFTPVTIALNEGSTTLDQIRYSVDGSHPSLLYTGPFTLSVPPFDAEDGGLRTSVVVRAITVSAHDGSLTSGTTEACLTVYRAGHSFLDPNIPAPVVRIRAVKAELYFDESRRLPNTQIIYQLVYIGEARQKVKFSRNKGVVYTGAPIPLRDDVAFVYAWTFKEDMYTDELLNPHTDQHGHQRARSSATVYDCTRATSWNRGSREEATGDTGSGIPPPFICVQCKEMEVFFEEPPVGGIICYTMDGTEPVQPDASTTAIHMAGIGRSGTVHLPRSHKKVVELGTHIYKENQPIHVTLLRTERVVLTARTFIPLTDPAANSVVTGYRFGERFNRSFFTQ